MTTTKNRLFVPFLALGVFWALSGCVEPRVARAIGSEARTDCEAFCSTAEMVLVEIRHLAATYGYECICAEVDPE